MTWWAWYYWDTYVHGRLRRIIDLVVAKFGKINIFGRLMKLVILARFRRMILPILR